MGMVLSAVGACLLFILKVVGILLLIILVLAALLLLCPFCADVCWQNDMLTVKAGALGITFPVFQYPKPEPPAQPEEPKGFTGRLKAKFRAWRAECKRKKAEKKAAQPAKPTVQDKVSFRVSAQALFIVIAAVRVLYEFWRKKVLDIFI